VSVALPAGSTVDEAMRAAGLGPAGPVGIFGKQVKPDRVLQDGDRVELYRPLVLEPMEARRRRARRR
jgi:putative ubiquitin-RnfH superfamily antitoxin RatB of RatAB toxin-antitoxin module